MNTVYLLQHVRESLKEGKNEDIKIIGVYRNESDARVAISKLKQKSGFSSYVDGFHVDKYELGKDHWEEGF